MCLIACAWQHHPDFPLVVAANRDEFYRRPTEAAGRWPEAPHVVAGRDREQGGSWLGISEHGRFAAVTNARGVGGGKDAPSRGFLVRDFLCGDDSAAEYAEKTLVGIHRYAGCNLLVGDIGSERNRLFYLTNHPEPELRELGPGLHALSNGHIDHLWPKMRKVRDGLADNLDSGAPDHETLFELMTDRTPADDDLPDTGVGRVLEQQLSPIFIKLPIYGTRCTTVLIIKSNGIGQFSERRFDRKGKTEGQSDIELGLDGA